MTRHSLVPFLLTLGACGGSFEPATRIDKLRLLAVAADQPSAAPGDRVELQALFADTRARTLQWGFALCRDAASSAALDCALSIDPESLVVQDEARFVFTMPEAGASARDAAVGIAVVACPGEITAGSTLGIPLECRVEGRALDLSQFELGIKRVFFAGESANQNPQISALRFDGETWPEDDVRRVSACERDTDDVTECPAAQRHEFAVDAPDVSEAYLDTDGVSAREQAIVQFYGTGGRFEFEALTPERAATRWVARPEDRGELLTLYFVVRDSRGGVSWQSRQVQVE